MAYLILKSYLSLITVEIEQKTFGFKRVYKSVRGRRTASIAEDKRTSYEQIARAMDLACVFYPKTVLCLQRSVAAVRCLRRSGWPAELVIGCAISTFEDHAWVELGAVVINDKPYMHEMYQVLDRL